MARRISYVFEKKEKGEELTKAGIGTRHPLPSDETVTRGDAGTSSSSGETTTGGGGLAGILPLAGIGGGPAGPWQ
jgi:hypothetical protein